MRIKFFTLFIIFAVCNVSRGKALAQSCTIDNVINGSLGTNLDDLNTISSRSTSNSLSTTDARAGSLDLSCADATAEISISSVVQTNDVGMTLSSFTTTLSGLSSEIVSTNGGSSMPASVETSGTKTIEFEIDATYNDVLKPGNYSFFVNLEVSP